MDQIQGRRGVSRPCMGRRDEVRRGGKVQRPLTTNRPRGEMERQRKDQGKKRPSRQDKGPRDLHDQDMERPATKAPQDTIHTSTQGGGKRGKEKIWKNSKDRDGVRAAKVLFGQIIFTHTFWAGQGCVFEGL